MVITLKLFELHSVQKPLLYLWHHLFKCEYFSQVFELGPDDVTVRTRTSTHLKTNELRSATATLS